MVEANLLDWYLVFYLPVGYDGYIGATQNLSSHQEMFDWLSVIYVTCYVGRRFRSNKLTDRGEEKREREKKKKKKRKKEQNSR